jgi:hypothetical protein
VDITAIDPGGTTGLVNATITDSTLVVRPWQRKLTPGQLFTHLKAQKPNLVICEDFEFRPNSPQGLVLTSAHLIGVVMLYCEQHDIELRMQNAAYAKAGFYSKINNMKKAGVYVGGVDYEHAMDAMRHFMQWFYFGPGYKFNKSPQVRLVQ